MIWAIRFLAIFLIVLTLLPFIVTGKWWVRGWEISRTQLAAILLIPIFLAAWYLASEGFNNEIVFWMFLCISALAWQVSHIVPLSPLWPKEVNDVTSECATFSFFAVNVKVNSTSYAIAQREIASEKADILLLIEPDKKWHQALRHLREQYRFHHEELRADGLGMALWSTFDLCDSHIRQTLREDHKTRITNKEVS